MEREIQGHVEYEGLGIQRKISKKLVDWYVGPYIIDEVISTNAVKLWLPISMRIHLVVNVSQIVQYRDQVGGQKKEKVKLVKVGGVKE